MLSKFRIEIDILLKRSCLSLEFFYKNEVYKNIKGIGSVNRIFFSSSKQNEPGFY